MEVTPRVVVSGLVQIFIFALLLVMFSFNSLVLVNAKLLGKEKTVEPIEGKMGRKMEELARLMIGGQGSAESLTLRQYRELIFETQRRHSAFVLFYNDREICPSCDGAIGSFEQIAKSFASTYYTYDAHTSTWNLEVPAFFVKVRMTKDYRHMLVDLNPTEPSIYYFAPSPSPKHNQFEHLQYEHFVSGHSKANTRRILAWINDVSGIQITVENQTQSSGFTSMLFALSALGTVIILNIIHFGYWDALIEALKQWNYAYTIVVVVIWLLSGQMFNSIRYTPMMGSYGFSPMSFVFPGSRSQYGIESVLIMLLYGLLIYGVTQLIELRERQLSENLPNTDVQKDIMTALTCVFFAFMVLQFFSQMKLRY